MGGEGRSDAEVTVKVGTWSETAMLRGGKKFARVEDSDSEVFKKVGAGRETAMPRCL